jgi:hypothetical protein
MKLKIFLEWFMCTLKCVLYTWFGSLSIEMNRRYLKISQKIKLRWTN